jgi:uncharacterized protein YrrD
MLHLSKFLLNKPVLSHRAETTVATVLGPIINPDSLKIEGFYCKDRFDNSKLVLVCQDIREVINKGFVINDHEVLARPEDLIRLKTVMDLDFDLIDKQVVTVNKQKIGKVSDYATDIDSMYIQKIYITQSIFRSFTGGSLIIDRTQISEITPTKIIVNDLLESSAVAATASA